MATVQIRPATVADAGALAKIHADAYGSIQDFYTAMFKRSLPDLLPDLTAFALERGHSQFLVATDPSSGQPVGFIRWDIEDPSQPPPSVEDVPNRPKIEPKEHLKEVYSRFRDARDEEQDAQYEEASAEQKHAFVKHLMIDPSHQRKGIGGQLMKAMLAKTDAEGIPAFLFSGRESHGLYTKLGFKTLASWTIDNGHWAKEIEQHEQTLGMTGNLGLAKQFEGVTEDESLMVRQPEAR